MSGKDVIAIVELLNTLAQLAKAVNISLPELVEAKRRADFENREFGQADVDAEIAKSRSKLEAYKAKLKEML